MLEGIMAIGDNYLGPLPRVHIARIVDNTVMDDDGVCGHKAETRGAADAVGRGSEPTTDAVDRVFK
jgi:hypothetical protein